MCLVFFDDGHPLSISTELSNMPQGAVDVGKVIPFLP